ncbi:MAG: hypothetical protein OXE57_06440 [Alphaproteobacteria bacterium]|nr:hypothetical protein [Alphaproteobacteria bacterium]
MTKPRNRKPNMNHTVSLTDGELAQVQAWAAARGESVSAWFCECALNVDLFPEAPPVRPLVLDAGEQRGLSRDMAAAARDMRSVGEASSNLADDMRALLEMRLKAMDRDGRREQAVELLRRVLGDERAAVVAAAVLPETEEASNTPNMPARSGSDEGPNRTAQPQPDLFEGSAGGPSNGA